MPELPEVQNVVNTLGKLILNQRITSTTVYPKGESALGKTTPAEFSTKLTGQVVNKIERCGKYIIITFNENIFQLIVHLRMTGRLLYVDTEKPVEVPDPYTRLEFNLSRGRLYFSDKRRFATAHIVSNAKKYPGIQKLGPDALSTEFTAKYLHNILINRKKPIYSALLDQTIVAGLGNIYVCEVLARTKIHPLSSSMMLDKKLVEILHMNIIRVLQEAINAKGTTFMDYKNAEGQKGSFQQKLLVYGKKKTTIEQKMYSVSKVKIGGRSAFYVQNLQSLYP